MRVLLVEPDYRRGSQSFKKKIAESEKKRDDETLWYPPLGLMKLSTFHKQRGDEVRFVNGCDNSVISDLFNPSLMWDRVYITTLFTFGWKEVVETIEFYKSAVGGSAHKIFVGGIMASLLPHELYEETGIVPIQGTLDTPKKIRLDGDVNIDHLMPDYSILDNRIYAINDTLYAYTSRGCVNKCAWCGVPKIEGALAPYVDIRASMRAVNETYGEKTKIRLMDNNVLASEHLEQIVDDLLELGFGKGNFSEKNPKRLKVVDFNQGLDSGYINKQTMELISKLHIRPFRVAFDRLSERDQYENAIRLASEYGVKEFSNYMLFNFNDKPIDLYERINVNIDLNKEFCLKSGTNSGAIYSYPMRYAPIKDLEIIKGSKYGYDQDVGKISREYHDESQVLPSDFIDGAVWNKKFLRNIEVIKAATHGTISPTPGLARRAVGRDKLQFIANLYMPEHMLRFRDVYEATAYEGEKKRDELGTGDIEDFYEFIDKNARKPDEKFIEFHKVIANNSTKEIREFEYKCCDEEYKRWLKLYLKK